MTRTPRNSPASDCRLLFRSRRAGTKDLQLDGLPRQRPSPIANPRDHIPSLAPLSRSHPLSSNFSHQLPAFFLPIVPSPHTSTAQLYRVQRYITIPPKYASCHRPPHQIHDWTEFMDMIPTLWLEPYSTSLAVATAISTRSVTMSVLPRPQTTPSTPHITFPTFSYPLSHTYNS